MTTATVSPGSRLNSAQHEDRDRWSGSTIVDAARRGDRAALADLHTVYAPMVHGILLANVPLTDVDDLVQEVFVKALRKLPTLRDGDVVGSWLATIARNVAIDHHRRRQSGFEELDETGTNQPPDEPSSRGEEVRRALAAIRSLPQAYRETLVLRLVEGLSGPEIAARLGMTHGSVRVNLHRGMSMLRDRLDLEEHR